MHIYMIRAVRWKMEPDKERGGVSKGSKEEFFVEASSMAAALALNPEQEDYEIELIHKVGNIIARETPIEKRGKGRTS